MEINELVKMIREKNQYTYGEFSKKTGVSSGFLSNVEKGRKKVSKKLYGNLVKLFPEYKKELDKAYMEQVLPKIIKYDINTSNKKIPSSNLKEENAVDYVVLPLYGMASAGSGQINYMEDKIEEIKIPKIFGNPKKEDFVTKVNGDSMEPKYSNGDLILVRTSDFIDIREMNNKEAVVDIAEERFLKKVEFEEGTGVLRLKSYNTAYADIVVEPRELEAVRVVGTIGMIIKQFQY